jgi:uncharacterized protein YsxB (DUF464 family)
MILIEVTTSDGVPLRVRSRGHARRKGSAESAPCAAVSVVLKSLGLTVAGDSRCGLRVTADRPGEFDLEVDPGEAASWVAAVWSMAGTTLREIAAEWPEQVRLMITEEKKHGT